MNPFIYGAVILSGIFILLLYTLYTTHWELLDTRKKAAEWERKYKHARRRPPFPPNYMQESGLDIQVGEYRVPLYKPFGVFNFTRSEELTEYCILDGNRITEKRPLPNKLAVTNGDTLYLYVEVRNPSDPPIPNPEPS